MLMLLTLQARAEGDSKAGQKDAAVCAACHGMDGNSVVAQWPKLAGQHPGYLLRQLKLIRGGARPVPEMAPIVANLTDQQLEDLAAYFSTQSPKPDVADPKLVEAGRQLFRAGNSDTGVPACMACHGPAGEGIPLAGYPMVAGQHAVYLTNQLQKFRNGQTWGEDDTPSKVMVGVAQALTDDEIKSVTSYIQGLHRVSGNPSGE